MSKKSDEPPKLTEEERTSLENFFQNWRLDWVNISDTNPGKAYLYPGLVKISLTLRKKRRSSEKLVPEKHSLRMDNPINQVSVSKYGTLQVDFTTHVSPHYIDIDGPKGKTYLDSLIESQKKANLMNILKILEDPAKIQDEAILAYYEQQMSGGG